MNNSNTNNFGNTEILVMMRVEGVKSARRRPAALVKMPGQPVARVHRTDSVNVIHGTMERTIHTR